MDIEEAIKELESLSPSEMAIETILKELENSIPKEKVEKYLKEEQERFEVYKRESKTYVKNSENITAEMNNDINKLLSEISKKDKIIDLILKEQIEDGYLVNFHNLEEARKYYEDRI